MIYINELNRDIIKNRRFLRLILRIVAIQSNLEIWPQYHGITNFLISSSCSFFQVPTEEDMIAMWKKKHNIFAILHSWYIAEACFIKMFENHFHSIELKKCCIIFKKTNVTIIIYNAFFSLAFLTACQ
jgi:hypothetical protein